MVSDVGDGCVAQSFEEGTSAFQFCGVDAAIIVVRVECADEDQKEEQQQRQDELLERERGGLELSTKCIC